MAEEKLGRSKGVVLRFYDKKGFGFIQPDEGGEDLFVHQTAIKSDGYRTLQEGQAVEFTIILEGDKTRAVDVTASGGGTVDLNSRRDNNGNTRRGGDRRIDGNRFSDRRNESSVLGNRSGGGVGRGCYNCGDCGHVARDCNNGGPGGDCYNCGGFGHMKRDCPSGARGGGGGGYGRGGGISEGRTCFKCGQSGHLARDCNDGGGNNGYSRGDGGSGGGTSFTRGQPGHLARERVVGRSVYSRESAGGMGKFGGGKCFNCGEPGHMAKECEQYPQGDCAGPVW